MALLRLKNERLKAAGIAAAVHAVLAYAFITGLGYEVVHEMGQRLKVFDITEPPPPIVSIPAEARSPEPEGAAAPPSKKASPSPVVVPPPEIKIDIPPPVRTVDKETPAPPGSESTVGASVRDGPGTGAGGQGQGAGSGGTGSGTGGGIAIRAKRERGALSGASDYPRTARRAGVEGTVHVRYTVEPDGRVINCRVTRSSGSAELDATTCRLIEKRFRYRAARDSAGRPVRDTVFTSFEWYLPYRPPSPG